MNLPADFQQTVQAAYGPRGQAFLNSLPELVHEAARRWGLTDLCPATNLSYNFVEFANCRGQEVVLKLGVPHRELTSEIASLRIFEGRGTVRLLEADAELGMLLLERLRPGQMLASLTDDAQATHIAADVMLSLRRPGTADPSLIRLQDWLDGFHRLRARFEGGTGPLDRRLVEHAEAEALDFFREEYQPTLIHGDLHHFNILSSERGWLAIDPKGVVGPAAYEVGPFLINPWVVSSWPPDAPRLTQTRIAILSERLGLDERCLLEWGMAHAVLSACWSLEDNQDWQPAMQCARLFSDELGSS